MVRPIDQTPNRGGDRQVDTVHAEIQRRIRMEKQRSELLVTYYRIGHTLAFPLPLSVRPENLPRGLPERDGYPWETWLSWTLEDRWRILHYAWRYEGDETAESLLSSELAALEGWESFQAWRGGATLVTAHIAAALALVLKEPEGWDASRLHAVRRVARTLLDRDLIPWYEHTFTRDSPKKRHLGNVVFIALVRGAHLARVIDHPYTSSLERDAEVLITLWQRARSAPRYHTEGSGYDGYILDHMTEWLGSLDDFAKGRDPLCTTLVETMVDWYHASLPGAVHQLLPIGDAEDEMTFWMSALGRIAQWSSDLTVQSFWRALAPERMRAAALLLADRPLSGDRVTGDEAPDRERAIKSREHVGAVTMRTGWERGDVLVGATLSRCALNHLHYDGGHLVIASHSRCWIDDPGYVQFREGEEREFTIGAAAHNVPVINGRPQVERAVRLVETQSSDAASYVRLDLTHCYKELPVEGRITREVWFINGPSVSVAVRDTFVGLTRQTEVATHWHSGVGLAWGFCGSWAKLSDGSQSLWLTTIPKGVCPLSLSRHPGSRGQLTLESRSVVTTECEAVWWIFTFKAAGCWEPPRVTLRDRDSTSAPLWESEMPVVDTRNS